MKKKPEHKPKPPAIDLTPAFTAALTNELFAFGMADAPKKPKDEPSNLKLIVGKGKKPKQ